MRLNSDSSQRMLSIRSFPRSPYCPLNQVHGNLKQNVNMGAKNALGMMVERSSAHTTSQGCACVIM